MFSAKPVRTAGRVLMDLDQRAHALAERVDDLPGSDALDALSKLGDQPEIRLIAGALIAGGVFAGNDRLTRAGSRMMIAHEAATLAKDAVKRNIDRKRPRSAGKRSEKTPRRGTHRAKEKTSFPSGHSAGTIAAARAFSREYPAYGIAALAAAGLVAAAQIPRRAHYPTDVAAGLAIGLLSETLVDLGWRAAGLDREDE